MAKLYFTIAVLFVSLSLVLCVPKVPKSNPGVRRNAGVRNNNENDAKAFLAQYNERAMEVYYEDVLAAWTYQTDITEEHQQKMVRIHTKELTK